MNLREGGTNDEVGTTPTRRVYRTLARNQHAYHNNSDWRVEYATFTVHHAETAEMGLEPMRREREWRHHDAVGTTPTRSN